MTTKIFITLALISGLSFSAMAGAPKGETKADAKDTKVEAPETPALTTSETKDFYVDDDDNRLDIEYPSMGECQASENQNCHATYTRASSSSPWVLQGTIKKGIRPF